MANSENMGSAKFVARGFACGTKQRSGELLCFAVLSVTKGRLGNIERKTKAGVIGRFCFVQMTMEGGDKRDNVKAEVRSGEFCNIRRNVVAVISATKMCNIRRHLCDGEIVHPFIKAGVGCNLDFCGFDAMLENVACCMWNMSKEDVFMGVGKKLGSAMSWGADPDATAKSLNVGEIFLFAS